MEGKRGQRRSASFTEELHTERGLRLKKVSRLDSLYALSQICGV
jgi:hypothetical protein